MKPKILAVILANLFAVSAGYAQESPFRIGGSVSVGGLGSDIDAEDESKAHEYRDLESGGLLHFDLGGRAANGWFNLFGENIGRRDQFADLSVGLYGLFKGRLYLNDIIHNSVWNGRTPLNGVGGATLEGATSGTGTGTMFNQDLSTWNTFDAKMKRRNIGGYAEVSPGNSVYLRVDANESRWSGLRVISGSNGPSPVYGYVDLPSPVDYVIKTVSAEAGYSSRTAHVSASLSRSNFTNDNDLLRWTNPNAGGALDTIVLPQDNEQTKWAINGALKRLPFGDSTLAARYVYAKTENSVPIQQSMLNTVHSSTPIPTPTNVANFDGEIVHRTASVSLTSQWTRELDSRVYWNSYKKENESTEVVFVDQGLEPHIFSYDKRNAGVEVGYRLARQTKLLLGYDFVDLDRDRADYDNTEDKKAYLEVKSGAWDVATLRARVQRLKRRSNFLEGDIGVDANDPLYLQRYVGKFDAANVDQDLVKFSADFAPAPLLDVGVEAIFKENDYKDTLLGRTNDRRREIYASVSYGDAQKWRVTAFADVERIKYDSFHRNISTVAGGGVCSATNPNCFDPINGPSVTGSYNWSAKLEEKNYAMGLGADMVYSDRLKFNASYTYQKTRGSTDLTTPLFPAPFVTPTDVDNVDDVKIHTLNVKGTYKASPKLDVTAGYAYEKYDYTDTAFENYTYIVPGSTPDARAYLSGQWGFNNYKANILYVYLTYRF